ncbi:unnamed protein product [Miscanthus lutarioriparius]|uniref:Uncharacterized protein n=1 Tax=Miscanthus lutarioriparius TaxID=422564 RepID=A0A811Q9K0_9POAL|nr:unnamed protein product [Miscanthus lutarioriparius]
MGPRPSHPLPTPLRRPCSVFILDSRATSHVVGDVSLFSPSFRSRTPTTTAGSPAAAYQAHDGRVLTVAGVGTVSCDNHRVAYARCVPDLCTGLNLVSVQQLADCGYLVMFGGGQCSVMEQSSGKITGKGRLHADDSLYHLEFLDIPHDKTCEDSTPT